MNISLTAGQGEEVSQSDSEALLAEVVAKANGIDTGIVGPDSVSWKINREAAVFLGAGRAALLQLAHPWVAAALAQHSNLLANPIARFHNTFRIVFTLIFGSQGQAVAAARHLYGLHTTIQGELPEDVAAYRRGAHYRANEIAALRWVYATLVESALIAYEAVLPPLSASERAAYHNESKILAGLFGLPSAALPGDWESFLGYVRAMCASDALGVSADARKTAHSLLAGAGSWIHPPRWYRAMTTLWMPNRLRREFGLELGEVDLLAAQRALRRLPGVYRKLPGAIRFVGPWHEAQARLAKRSPFLVTRISNRFWIGQSRLPFAGERVAEP